MFKLVLEKAEEPEIKLPTSAGSWKKQESSRKRRGREACRRATALTQTWEDSDSDPEEGSQVVRKGWRPDFSKQSHKGLLLMERGFPRWLWGCSPPGVLHDGDMVTPPVCVWGVVRK